MNRTTHALILLVLLATLAATVSMPVSTRAQNITPQILPAIHLTGNPMRIAVNPQANKVYVVCLDYNDSSNFFTLNIIDGSTHEVETISNISSGFYDLAVNPNTNLLYISNGFLDQGSVTVRDGSTGDFIADIPIPNKAKTIAVNSTNGRVYTINEAGTIFIIDSNGNKVVSMVDGGYISHIAALNPVSNKLYVGYNDDGGSDHLRVFDISPVTPVEIASDILPMSAYLKGGVNTKTNMIYFVNQETQGATIEVVDGAADAHIATVKYPSGQDPTTGTYTAAFPYDIAINEANNEFYVAPTKEIDPPQAAPILSSMFDTRDGDTSIGTYNIKSSITGYIEDSRNNSRQQVAFNPTTGRAYIIKGIFSGGISSDVYVIQAAEPAMVSYEISGQVKDLNNIPVANVTVVDDKGHTTTTLADGTYILHNLPEGAYTITPTKSGYSFSPPSLQVSVPPGQSNQDFTASLTPGTSKLELTVVSYDTLAIVNNQYSPNPFEVVALVQNTGTATSSGTILALQTLPDELSLAPNSPPATIILNDIAPGQYQSVTWLVQAAPQYESKVLNYSVSLIDNSNSVQTANRQVIVPVLARPITLTAPFDSCSASTSRTPSPAQGDKKVLKEGFSVAIAECDVNTGGFKSRVVVFGGTEGGFNLISPKNPPTQEASSSITLVSHYTPQVTGNLRIEANLTIQGTAGAGAGSSLAASIDARDEIGLAIVDWLKETKNLTKLIGILKDLQRATGASTGTDVSLEISGGTSGIVTTKLTGAGATFPTPGPYGQSVSYDQKAIKLSITVLVTRGQPINIAVRTTSRARSWGWAAAFTNLANPTISSRLDSIVLSMK